MMNDKLDKLDPALLNELLLNISTLCTIYQKPPSFLVANVKKKQLSHSSALVGLIKAEPGDNSVDSPVPFAPIVEQSEFMIDSDTVFKDVFDAEEQVPISPLDLSNDYQHPYSQFKQYLENQTEDELDQSMNTTWTNRQSIINTNYNPFLSNGQVTNDSSFNTKRENGSFPTQSYPINNINNIKSTQVNTTQGVDLSKSDSVTLDPFSKTKASQNSSLSSLNIFGQSDSIIGQNSSIIPKKKPIVLNDNDGLEVQAEFCRRNGRITLELNLINHSLQILSDFGLLFNVNA